MKMLKLMQMQRLTPHPNNQRMKMKTTIESKIELLETALNRRNAKFSVKLSNVGDLYTNLHRHKTLYPQWFCEDSGGGL